MNPIEREFFNDLEKKLWTAADKLRSNLRRVGFDRRNPNGKRVFLDGTRLEPQGIT